jgi:uncharacterized phosphosugar-binding protein
MADEARTSPEGATAALTIIAIATDAVRAELPALTRVAHRIADRLAAGGTLFTFGAGHAYALAMELCSRAGGLRGVVAMNLEDLREDPRPAYRQLMDSEPERAAENGPALLDLHGVGAGDALVIASNSGRNAAAVHMALSARERGTYVAAFTSLDHSRAVASRHPSGRRLFEVADDVVDNHCPLGDAVLALGGGPKVSSASTVSFAVLAEALNAALIARLVELGVRPEVLVSANVDADR